MTKRMTTYVNGSALGYASLHGAADELEEMLKLMILAAKSGYAHSMPSLLKSYAGVDAKKDKRAGAVAELVPGVLAKHHFTREPDGARKKERWETYSTTVDPAWALRFRAAAVAGDDEDFRTEMNTTQDAFMKWLKDNP